MAELSGSQRRFLQQLITNQRCRVCRHPYDREQVRLAARHDQVWIVSVRCSHCRQQQIFHVMRQRGEESILRDVNDHEEERFAAMPPISSDDLLDLHVYLRTFDGDFKRIFDE